MPGSRAVSLAVMFAVLLLHGTVIVTVRLLALNEVPLAVIVAFARDGRREVTCSRPTSNADSKIKPPFGKPLLVVELPDFAMPNAGWLNFTIKFEIVACAVVLSAHVIDATMFEAARASNEPR